MILARENHNYDLEQEQWGKRPQKVRKVRKVRRFKRNASFFYASVAVIAFIIFLLLTTRYAQTAAAGYEILDMKKQLKSLQAENQSLQMKVAELESLERIETEALGKLGMVKPETSEGVKFVAVETNVTAKNDNEVQKQSEKNIAAGLANKKEETIPVVEAISRLINNWTGKVAQAEEKASMN